MGPWFMNADVDAQTRMHATVVTLAFSLGVSVELLMI